MKVAVVGLGYAGLCTAACFTRKFDVIGIDVDRRRISQLTGGDVPIHEKGLPALIKKSVEDGALSFSDSYESLNGAGTIFVAVGTPSKADGSIDLSQVTDASRRIGRELGRCKNKPLVVIKSTVTPGTTTKVVKPLLEEESGKECGVGFGLCSNPEFLREGAAIDDTLHPDRIIIGPLDRSSGLAMRSFYKKFFGPSLPPVVETTPENSELIKYASNAFLATKISFINFVARVCENLPGADVAEVALAMGFDPRIGGKYLQAGPGFGGACFPKDARALSAYVEQLGMDASLLRSVLAINDSQPEWIVSKLERKLGNVAGKGVAVLGVAFKEGSDDVRESRAIVLAKSLFRKGARVSVSDPMAIEGAKRELGQQARYCETAQDCIRGADAAVVLTGWAEFKRLKPDDFVRLMRTPILIDARRIYDPKKYDFPPLDYTAVGRGYPSRRVIR